MHFITGMHSLSLYITTCHARDGVSDTPEHSNDIYLPSSSPNRRHRHRGMAASNDPLHRDASASRQPSTHSLHCFTARNAALPSHKVEGLIDPLRPWSGSRSCGGPPRPLPLPFEHALRADTRTLTAARARAVRVQPCHRILEATTMRRTAGIENKIRTRVSRHTRGVKSLSEFEHPTDRGTADRRRRRRGATKRSKSLERTIIFRYQHL